MGEVGRAVNPLPSGSAGSNPVSCTPGAVPGNQGGVAEWLGAGLQPRSPRFDSELRFASFKQSVRKEDRPWPISGVSEGRSLAVGPVLRSSTVTPCVAYTLPAGTCSAIGSPTQAITSGVKPTAPTGSASSRSRSNRNVRRIEGSDRHSFGRCRKLVRRSAADRRTKTLW